MSHPSHRLPVILILQGGVSLEVEPLTQQQVSAHLCGKSVEILRAEPERPFLALAYIVGTSQRATEDTIRDHILLQAQRFGADAVVLGQAHTVETMGQGSHYRSTEEAAGTSDNSYTWGPWGSWDPASREGRGLPQGAADQTAWTLSLSGLAIRYNPTQDQVPSPVFKHAREAKEGL